MAKPFWKTRPYTRPLWSTAASFITLAMSTMIWTTLLPSDHAVGMRIQEEPVVVRQAEQHPLSPYRYQLAERLCGDLSGQADSHAVGKDDFADGMSHLHRLHPLSAGEDDLPGVAVDAHGKELTVPVRFLLADLGLLIIEVAFIHPDLSAEGPGRHVALKKGLICRPECVYRFHTVLYL